MAGQFKASRFPIYMDDADLFSKSGMGPKRHPPFNEEIFLQMFMKLGRLWWSRLVIATRGYAITDFKGSDQIVFPCDDAFVYIHQRLVETGMDMGLQLLRDIEILEATGSDALRALFEGKDIANNQNPFFLPNKQNTFRRLFGEPSSQTYRTAFMRGFCYLMFFNIFTKLQKRWIEQATALSAGNPTCIEIIGQQLEPFQDPDWRPDERVVIYHQFGFGQKAWVLTDFDRYIIKYWKPNGVRVIFGYEYVESKLADGFRICRQCGILESHVEQFKRCLVCLKQKIEDVACYCSEDCEDLNRSAHVKQHQANPKAQCKAFMERTAMRYTENCKEIMISSDSVSRGATAASERRNTRTASADSTAFVIRPNYQQKFRQSVVKNSLREVLLEHLGDKEYSQAESTGVASKIADEIKEKLKGLDLQRYKFIVHVMIGEQRGEGIKSMFRALWDSDNDSYASDIFMNGSLFCVATAYGIFYY